MVFFNSRMLPGQANVMSICKATDEISIGFGSCFRKWSTRTGMSSLRSRSGGGGP